MTKEIRVLLTAWRDLQFRKRRVMIAVIGTALVFALSIIMTGIAASFGNEVRTAVRSFEADGWLRPEQATGTLIGGTPVPIGDAPTAERLGAERVDPVVFRNTSIGRGEKDQIAYFGVVRGGVGDPTPSKGRKLRADGEIVVDTKFGRSVGDVIRLAGQDYTVVGTVSKRSILAGVPLSYVSLADAQKLAFGGQPLANAFAVRGTTDRTLRALSGSGWAMDSASAVEEEMLQPLVNATKTISLVRGLLWFVAALIVGSVMYLQALERTRDFAVLKATGSSSASIGGSMALQAVFLALIASAIAAVVAAVLAPQFPMNVEIPSSAFLLLPVIAIGIGLLAVLTGLRRSLAVEPAFAFRGA